MPSPLDSPSVYSHHPGSFTSSAASQNRINSWYPPNDMQYLRNSSSVSFSHAPHSGPYNDINLEPYSSNSSGPLSSNPTIGSLQVKRHMYPGGGGGGGDKVQVNSVGIPQFIRYQAGYPPTSRIRQQPPFRRAIPEGGFLCPLQALTTQLSATYRICNPNFKYESSRNPRRVLTKPSKGTKNDGYDNEDSDYILYVNDILGSEESGHKNRYLILDVLGQGTFGQVVKCQNLRTQEVVAVKVIKNRTAYFNQSMMEVSVLDLLSKQIDKKNDHHLLRLKDTFIHRQHLCLVFELLSVNLYELIKQNQFRGLSLTLVRVFAQQLLSSLALLSKAKLIHCDLKPENILLKNLESPLIKIIDFGSACDERQTVYTYIQSRFYRSPEVLLGLPYSAAIDIWSLGCIVIELFLGLPLFPGSSEYNQIARITEMLGVPPNWMLDSGKQASEYFSRLTDEYGNVTYRLRSMEEYSSTHKTIEQPSKRYFAATTLPDIIKSYPMPRKNMKPEEIEREMLNRAAFIDFARGLLNLNPLERWTPQQAMGHPFITQQRFTQPYVPLPHLGNSASENPSPGVVEQRNAEVLSYQRSIYFRLATRFPLKSRHSTNKIPNSTGSVSSNTNTGAGAGINTNSQSYLPSSSFNYLPNSSRHAVSIPPVTDSNTPTSSQPCAASAVTISTVAPSTTLSYQSQYSTMPTSNHQSLPPDSKDHHGLDPSMRYNHYSDSRIDASNLMNSQNRLPTDSSYNEQSGVPIQIQRIISHLDLNAPIQHHPSPAYYPPENYLNPNVESTSHMLVPGQRRSNRVLRSTSDQDFIRVLEDRSMEEGFVGN